MTRAFLLVSAAMLTVGFANEPAPPPRAFLEGRTKSISRQDVDEILSLAKKELARTGRASRRIYCIYVRSSDFVYVYHGEQRKHANDTEEALLIERVHGHWRLDPRQIGRGAEVFT